jgi:hypothetical protein
MTMTMNTQATAQDAHAQLRSLYQTLLSHQDRFDEFKHLLSLYTVESGDAESPEAREVRVRLNERVRDWVGGSFDGLSIIQMLQWRAIVVDERLNVALSPWKESNVY